MRLLRVLRVVRIGDRPYAIWLVEPASQLQEEPVYPTFSPWFS